MSLKPVTGKIPAIQKQSDNVLVKRFNSKLKKTSPDQHTYTTDELLVTYKSHADDQKISSLKQRFSLTETRKLQSIKAEVVKIPKGTTVTDTINLLKNDPSVETVQPNYKYTISSVNTAPNYYNQLWGLNNHGQDVLGVPGTKDVDVDAPEARTNFSGKLNQVLVGVIDTGVDINHPDLQNAIWTNPGEIPNDGIDNDHDGFIDDVHGWDFVNKDNSVYDPMDGDEHGTHVSGTIAAELTGNNPAGDKGVFGVAPNVKIVPIKAFGADGTGTSADEIAAIEYAQKLGIKILNCSWGGPENDPLLEEAMKNYNGLIVAAAGNEGSNNDSVKVYPAGYDLPNLISVAALDNTGNLASFSNYGPNSVDIAAPGVNILSTVPKFPEDQIKQMLGLQQLGASAQITNTQLKYKAIFDGVGLEKFSNTDQVDVLAKDLSFLDIPKDKTKKILLVQDDEHDISPKLAAILPELGNYFADYLPVYQKILKGYNVDTVTINSDGSIKDSGKNLSDYNAVVWFTGHGMGLGSKDALALTKDDVTAITSYLNSGGRLLLTGQDALSGNETSPLVTDLFHLKVFSNMGPILNVEGLSGGIFANKKYTINHFDSSYPFADFIQSNSPDTVVNLKYVSDYNQAYNYESGTSMATPHVTGAAAVLLGLNSKMAPELEKLYLTSDGKSLPALNGFIKSGKIIKESKLNSFNENNFPGVPLTKNSTVGSLSQVSNKNDVYAFPLKAGEVVNLTLSGASGTDFDLYVYDQSAKDIKTANGIAGSSENSGTSNENILFKAPKAGIYYADVYAYKGKGSYKLNIGNFGGTYEDDSNALSYNGSWGTITNPQFSNGSAKSLNSSGEVDFSFVGTSFEWQGFKDPTQGTADVYVDGVKEASPSLFAATLQTKQSIYKKSFSAYGQHFVKIVWTGKSDTSARKNAAGINIDRFIVKSIPATVKAHYDSAKKQTVLTWPASTWAASYHVYRKEASEKEFKKLTSSPVTALSFTDSTAKMGKTYQYAVSYILKDGQETGLSVPSTFIFDDDVNGSIAVNSSVAKGSLDSVNGDLYDVYSRKLEQGKTYKFDLTGPAGTNFDLNLFDSGTATIYGTNPVKKATSGGSDESIVYTPAKTGVYYLVPTAKSGSGSYSLTLSVQSTKGIENTDSSIAYKGTWSKAAFGSASGGTISRTNNVASSLEYSFTGTGMKLVAMKDKNMGKADLYLDGKKVKTIDYYSSKPLYKQTIFEKQGLANSEHSIKIVPTGTKNSAATGTYINIDALALTYFASLHM
jgi:subtilisin family serine protease